MDPKACLARCDQAISDCDIEEAEEALTDYMLWRAGGGFEPIEVAGTLERGDAFARQCGQRILSAKQNR